MKYLFDKHKYRPILLMWILLLQEFDIEIKDKKYSENTVADHLPRLEKVEKMMTLDRSKTILLMNTSSQLQNP